MLLAKELTSLENLNEGKRNEEEEKKKRKKKEALHHVNFLGYK